MSFHVHSSAIGICMPLITAVILLTPNRVLAHDYWSNGERVDPVTKIYCCGKADHFELKANQVSSVSEGYRIRARFTTSEGLVGIDETVSIDHTQPSPDDKFHINLVDGRIRCFFAPLSF